MSLIKCPECGKDISDQSTVCVGCGFPIHDYLVNKSKEEQEKLKFKCNRCGFQNEIGCNYCAKCGSYLLQFPKSGYYEAGLRNDIDRFPIKTTNENNQFSGVYRYTLLGQKKEVYCPRCKSPNCSHYQEQRIIPEKTKTRYTANLNPLHPFTLVNKKEKVKRKEQTVTENKFICNSCGKIFY